MSNVERKPVEQPVGSGPPTAVDDPHIEVLEPREVPLGGPRAMLVERVLPNRDRRMIGAWCFVDVFGPTDVGGRQPGMQVPPHPHTGLQTVTWLLQGQVLHRDSLGTTQLVRPGELNLMTAGEGISHSEESPADGRPPVLEGVQLWTALPSGHRGVPAHFEHHAALPGLSDAGGSVTVLMGALPGAASPARTYSPLLGVDVSVLAGRALRLPLDPAFEHGVLALSEGLSVHGHPVAPGSMLYRCPGHDELHLTAGADGARAMVIGGVPFEEELVMWWNFVARSHQEIVEARSSWEDARTGAAAPARFGRVAGYDGPPLPAPELPNTTLRARGRTRER